MDKIGWIFLKVAVMKIEADKGKSGMFFTTIRLLEK